MSSQGVLPALRAYWVVDGLRLVHACKTAIAVAIGLGVCMRLELASPRTTMVSIVIVMMHQQAGMTIARSVFRFLGMSAGCLVSLLMVRHFSQTFATFYVALACWAACCVWGAYFYRNYQSYAFVLAGYAAAIVAVPAYLHPYGIIDSIIVTLSDVTLALVTASLVNALVFPQTIRDALFAMGQQHVSHLLAAVLTMLAGRTAQPDLDALHLKLTGEHTAMEASRAAAVFEDPDLRERLWTLQGITSEFLDVTTTLHALRRTLYRAEAGVLSAAAPAMAHLAGWAAAALPRAPASGIISIADLQRTETTIRARLEQFAEVASTFAPVAAPIAAQALYATFAILARDTLRDLMGYLHYFSLARTPVIPAPIALVRLARESPEVSTANRWAAGVGAARAFVVVLLIAALWFYSGWNGGSTAVTGATITAALFATFPNPPRASMQIFAGALLGSAVATIFSLAVMPHLDGYPLLAIALAPVIMSGSYLASFPNLGPLGVGFNIYFAYVANITNPATYDPPVLLDSAFAFCLGIGLASVTFRLLVPTSGDLLTRLYVRQIRRMVSRVACHDPCDARSLLRFENGVRDFLVQTGAAPGQAVPLRWGFTVLDVGSAVLKVRSLSARLDPPPHGWNDELQRWQETLGALFERIAWDTFNAAVVACDSALAYLDTRPSGLDGGVFAARAYIHVTRLELADPESLLRPERTATT